MTNQRSRSASGTDMLAMSDDDILALVRSESHRFARQIRWRDSREVIAGVVAAVVIGPAAFRGPWLARAGAILILASLVLIAFRLWRARRLGGPAADPTLPVADVLRAELQRVNAQVTLLESVVWWYVTPLVGGSVLLVAGRHPASWFTVGYALVAVLIAWGIVALNRRAVRRDLRPKRDQLAALLARLES